MHFNSKFKTKIDKEKDTVTLSIKISDGMATLISSSISEFNIMIAEYQSQLYLAEQEAQKANQNANLDRCQAFLIQNG